MIGEKETMFKQIMWLLVIGAGGFGLYFVFKNFPIEAVMFIGIGLILLIAQQLYRYTQS